MVKRSKKWLLAKMLADLNRVQYSMFKAFDKPYIEYDNFLDKLVAFVKNNKFIIVRTGYSNVNKNIKKTINDNLSVINMTLCQYLLNNCQNGLKYKHWIKQDTDKLAMIPDHLNCTEYDDLVDIQKYVNNINNRYSGILKSYSKFCGESQELYKNEKILNKLNYYIKYDV